MSHQMQSAVTGVSHTAKFYLWLLLLSFFVAPFLSAQTTSSITGTVRDKQNLAISGAEVQVTSTELAVDRKTTTETDGSYRLAALPPGIYTIKVSKSGFESALVNQFEVTLNKVLVYDIALEVGSVSQTVEISSTAALLETAVSSTGSTITTQQIEDMPINGR